MRRKWEGDEREGRKKQVLRSDEKRGSEKGMRGEGEGGRGKWDEVRGEGEGDEREGRKRWEGVRGEGDKERGKHWRYKFDSSIYLREYWKGLSLLKSKRTIGNTKKVSNIFRDQVHIGTFFTFWVPILLIIIINLLINSWVCNHWKGGALSATKRKAPNAWRLMIVVF